MGLTVTNARPSIAPTFGAEPMLGTNPSPLRRLGYGVPFCFDGATSICQRGKVEVAARAGKPVPAGWVISDTGEDMTDAPQSWWT
jgi:LDH2 family malate/lactate/ureidoglycolate dehydrogenase